MKSIPLASPVTHERGATRASRLWAPFLVGAALLGACRVPAPSHVASQSVSEVAKPDPKAGIDAVRRHDRDALRAFLAAGGDPDATTEAGLGALHFAAVLGDEDAYRILVNAGADVTAARGATSPTPLHMAAQGGHVRIMADLVARGAPLDAVWRLNGHTPLLEATFDARVEAVRWLLAQGADTGAVTLRGLTPSDLAAREADRNPDMGRILDLLNERNKALGLAADAQGRRDVTAAAKAQRLASLLNDVDPPRPENAAETQARARQDALLAAADKGDLAEVTRLVEKEGADVNRLSGRLGTTPLILASVAGKEDVVTYLLDHGADANVREAHPMGISALFKAAVFGHIGVAEALIAHGAVVNEQGPANGMSPLHDAIFRGRLDVAKLLLAHGADPDAQDYAGRSVRALAKGDAAKEALMP